MTHTFLITQTSALNGLSLKFSCVLLSGEDLRLPTPWGSQARHGFYDLLDRMLLSGGLLRLGLQERYGYVNRKKWALSDAAWL